MNAEINSYVGQKEKVIMPSNQALQYMGRIDDENPDCPVMVFPCSYVRVRFTGSVVKAVVQNIKSYWTNYIGVIIDGVQTKIALANEGVECLTLGKDLSEGEHELLLFKRMDSCHILKFYGLIVNEDSVISAPEALPERRIEVYGDSVSAGEVSEAVEYVGQSDPEHDGEYSNSYYSYSWLTARKLHAQLHDIAQGGIALLTGTGYFMAPVLMGMEEVYDKLSYHPDLGPVKNWDFTKYTPHVVIVAIGQNDNAPEDYMTEHYTGEKAANWRTHYGEFLKTLRGKYPKALIVLTTTILGHSPSWDQAIEDVCQKINDPKIKHFVYDKNGCGTSGHIRIPEAEKMSDELAAFINKQGTEIWAD